jgi:hypothetical protein
MGRGDNAETCKDHPGIPLPSLRSCNVENPEDVLHRTSGNNHTCPYAKKVRSRTWVGANKVDWKGPIPTGKKQEHYVSTLHVAGQNVGKTREQHDVHLQHQQLVLDGER